MDENIHSQLNDTIQKYCKQWVVDCSDVNNELTVSVASKDLLSLMTALKQTEGLVFDSLMSVTCVDYLHYGMTEFETTKGTETTFSRAVYNEPQPTHIKWHKPRFAVVYHLLSMKLNQRLTVKVYLSVDDLAVDSVVALWPCANWYEREVFDLYGVVFNDHPDLRRILTDYGFVGHPFRKDFPLIGHVEMRYDAAKQRCVYEKVSIRPRTTVPKVIRDDSRYASLNEEQS